MNKQYSKLKLIFWQTFSGWFPGTPKDIADVDYMFFVTMCKTSIKKKNTFSEVIIS